MQCKQDDVYKKSYPDRSSIFKKILGGILIAVGVLTHIAVQVIINVAVVTNTMPSTGIPLPFISYGGSSLVALLFEMGIALGVSNQIEYRE